MQCGRLTVIWYAKRTKHFRMHTKFSQNLLDGTHFCLPALRKHARGVGGVYSHCACAQRALIYNMAGKTLFDFGITVTRNSYTEGEEPHEGDARSEDEESDNLPAAKKPRRFNPKWKETYTWLESRKETRDGLETEVMYCNICQKWPELADPSSTLVKGRVLVSTILCILALMVPQFRNLILSQQ